MNKYIIIRICTCTFTQSVNNTEGGGGGGPPLQIIERIGKRKAAVLPEPVCAHAIRSLLPIMIGTACFCTGVGLLYCANCDTKMLTRQRGIIYTDTIMCIHVHVQYSESFRMNVLRSNMYP